MRKPLTANSARDATGEAVRYELRDKTVPGLRLVVQPSGVKTWAVRYRAADGQARRYTIGAYSEALGLGEARTMAASVKLGVVKGDDPAAARATARRAAPANTVLAAFKAYDRGHLSWGREYIDHETGQRSPAATDDKGNPVESAIVEDTAAGTRSFFVRIVLPKWGKRAAGSITRQDAVALLDGLKGFKDARRKGKTRLSHFFGWTMDRNATVTVNPAAGIQTETADSRERALTDEEIRAVWLACDQVGNLGAMVRAMLLTLARRTEVSEMPLAELSDTLWSIEGERTKNGRPMDIHRTDALNAVLASAVCSDGCEFVFEGRHYNRPMGGFSDLKAKLDAITGDAVGHWTLHDLRRTGTTLMQRLGIAFEVREACCNHTIKGVAGTYNRYAYAAEKRHAFEALAAEVARIVSDAPADSNVVPLAPVMAARELTVV